MVSAARFVRRVITNQPNHVIKSTHSDSLLCLASGSKVIFTRFKCTSGNFPNAFFKENSYPFVLYAWDNADIRNLMNGGEAFLIEQI